MTIDEMSTEQLKRELKDCRNELCYKCGRYRERHLGRCDGYRWMEFEKYGRAEEL